MSPARLSEWEIKHMSDIMGGMGDWFSADLVRLIAKADNENLAKLRLAFPDHVLAYEKWHAGELEEEKP